MTFQAGTSFGPYQIVEQIGQGGMGTVYKGFQPGLGRYVAIKVLPPHLAGDERSRERFRVEALAIGRLRHPNIVAALDFGEHGGAAYLVADYVDGGTLSDQTGEPLPLDYTTRILSGVASALDYAHTRGVIHRDVKPSNILLARDGTPMLTDFGLAAITGSLPRLTATGAAVGTPEYMAPEQASGGTASAASDRYALAVIAYEMLVGRPPFREEVPIATLLAHTIRPVEFPPESTLPAATRSVLVRGLAKEPGGRHASAGDLVRALEGSASGVAAAPPPPFAAPVLARGGSARRFPIGRRTILVGAAVAAAAVLGFALGDRDDALARAARAATPAPGATAPATPRASVTPTTPSTQAATPARTNPPATAAPTASAPVRAVPAVPAVPARGGQYWAAALGGSRDDVRLPISQTGPADGSAMRLPNNAIILATTRGDSGISVRLNAPSRASYVAELDLVIPADGHAKLTWILRRGTTGYALFLDPDLQAISVVFVNANGGSEALGAAPRIAETRSGRPFTLAASVVNERIQVFVDGRSIIDVTDRRVVASTSPEIGVANGIGTAGIMGARFYEAP